MSEDEKRTWVTILSESQQLNRTNWTEWKARIHLILMLQGLIGHIDGTNLASSPSGMMITIEASNTLAKWKKDDVTVKATITLNMMDLTGCGIDPITTTSLEFWKGLVALRERKNELTMMNAEEYLKNCKYSPGTDLTAHFEEMQCRRKVCRDLGSSMMDQCFVVHICHSLGEPLCHITLPLLIQSDPEAMMSTILSLYKNDLLQSG